MVRRAACLAVLSLCSVASRSSFAQSEPIDPMEGVTPVPATPPNATPPIAPPPAAPPPTTPPPAAPPAAPPSSPAASTSPATAPAAPLEERKTVTTFGLGPTVFATTGRGVVRPGLVLHVASRIPFDEHSGIGLRFAWGLTEFHRMEEWGRAGYDVGKWTTQAYADVYEWAGIKDNARLLRWTGAFFAFVGLIVPYMVSGLLYVVTPLAPTTYLEGDLTYNYDVASDKLGTGPYFKVGLGALAYVHPQTDKLFGGLGPTTGFGVRVGKADLGVHGTWLPPKLHGDNPGESTSVFVGSMTIGVSGN